MRFRPILMTTMAVLLSGLRLMLENGAGSKLASSSATRSSPGSRSASLSVDDTAKVSKSISAQYWILQSPLTSIAQQTTLTRCPQEGGRV
jgi:hypothetical protein